VGKVPFYARWQVCNIVSIRLYSSSGAHCAYCPDQHRGTHYASSTTGTGTSFPVVKQLWHGNDHPPLSSTEVKNENSYTYAPLLQFPDMLCIDPDLHITYTFYPWQEVSFVTKLLPKPTPLHYCKLRPHSTIYYLLPAARQSN